MSVTLNQTHKDVIRKKKIIQSMTHSTIDINNQGLIPLYNNDGITDVIHGKKTIVDDLDNNRCKDNYEYLLQNEEILFYVQHLLQ